MAHKIPESNRVRWMRPLSSAEADVLTPEAVAFLLTLHDRFDARRQELLSQRGFVHRALGEGRIPEFPSETRAQRSAEWTVANPPADLRDRRVEITGPVDRKMIINALNSGASVFMADFEDAHSPTWTGTVAGQANLRDAVRRRIEYESDEGKTYRLAPTTATLMVRPRGWHLEERHLRIDGIPISASLFDFGLFFFHNARELLRPGDRARTSTSPSWSTISRLACGTKSSEWPRRPSAFRRAASARPSSSKPCPAAFQMDEILYELREHSAGLNCGRWDYLFSFIKQFRDQTHVVFPDRARLGMTTPFLTAYTHLLIRTCHRRGAHAMGGMAAQIPIKGDPAANDAAMALVRADKEREVRAGHDGTWVAHPGLVPLARSVFDAGMPGPNQIDALHAEYEVHPTELIELPTGQVTDEGVRRNARVALRYLEAWFRGIGCVPIDHLMEDAATVEIARCQLWQWVHHGARLPDGSPVELARVRAHLADEVRSLGAERGGRSPPSVGRAARLIDEVVSATALEGFITERAYSELEEPKGSEG